jgi:hypothetical protein
MDATVVMLFLVQPLLLALFLDLWLGERRPSGLSTVALWMGVAIVGCMLVGAPLAWLVDRVAGGTVALDALVILSVGILTFAFLTGVWLARVGGSLLATLRR